VFLKITIQDIENSADSFNALDGKCKRRAMEMLRKFKNQITRKKVPLPANAVNPNIVIVADPTIIEASHTRSNGHIAPSSLLSRTVVGPVDLEGNILEGSEEAGSNSVDTSLLEETFPIDEFPARVDNKHSLCSLACTQIRMIFLKRLWNSNRNRKAMFFEVRFGHSHSRVIKC
jgi:hypothetical protein